MTKARILVVDDQPMVASVCAEALAQDGYWVADAGSGREALTRLESGVFDLLLCDLKMPDVDGLAVLRRARALYPNLAAIMMTSYGTMENAIEALRAGAQDFLLKPFEPEDLMAAVAKALEARRVEQLAKEQEALVEALRQSRMFADIFRVSPDGILVTTPADGQIVEANESLARMSGYALDELIGDTTARLWADPKDRVRYLSLLQTEGHVHDLSARFLTKSGDDLIGSISGEMISLETGQYILTVVRDVTERRQAQQQLRASEEKYRTLFENSMDAILLTSPDGSIQAANPAACRMFGRTEEEIIQAGRSGLVDPQDPRLEPGLAERARTGQVCGELNMLRRDGTPFPIEISTTIFLDSGGNPRTSMIIRDISERKRAEATLRRDEEVFRLFIEHVPAAIAMFDRDMKYIAVSRRYLLDYGIKDQSVIGRSHYEVFSDIPDRWKEAHRRCLAGAVETCERDLFPRADGRQDWVHWEIHPWYEATGEIGGLVLLTEVITERVRAEEAVRQRVDELAAIHAMGQHVSQTLSLQRVIRKALEQTLQAVQPDLAFLFLRERERLVLKGIMPPQAKKWFKGIPEHRVGECLCGLAVQEGQSAYSRDILVDSRCTWDECKEAGVRSFAALPLRSGDEFIGVLGLASRTERDFEAQSVFLEALAGQAVMGIRNARLHEQIRRHAEGLEARVGERTVELVAAKEHAESADRVKSAFLATMSHELRTPLNSIIGFTGMMLQGLVGPLNAEQSKQLGMVQTSARHLLTLINDILDISKIEAGQLEIENKKFNLRAAIESVVETASPQAKKKGLALRVQIAPDIGPIVSDPRRLRQILLNLVNNAIKFTDRGEVTLAAERLAPDGERPAAIQIRVADTGIGIKPENVDLIFESFTQLDAGPNRRHEGSGLGLPICKRLIALLGGDIWVESEWGRGSTFTFVLPTDRRE